MCMSQVSSKRAHEGEQPQSKKKKMLCTMGSGEVVHVIHFKAAAGKGEEFDVMVQEIAHGLYHLESGISDVRIAHPSLLEVCFILTFLTREDLDKFRCGPELDALRALRPVIQDGKPLFSTTGTLMPDTHTLPTLLASLKKHIVGEGHEGHDVAAVGRELNKWYPRPAEYRDFIHWGDTSDSSKYTRNLVFSNENMDVLLMCWPPGCKSAIHSHESSSCWVVLVEGCVVEVQYNKPKLDKQFLAQEMKCPTGAVGRSSKLRVVNEAVLSEDGVTSTYANDDIGVHHIENRTDKPAYTLHVYAPGLKKMKIFKEGGEVSVLAVPSLPYTSERGDRTWYWRHDTHPDGIVDISAWNKAQEGSARSSTTSPALSASALSPVISEKPAKSPPNLTL